MRAQLSAPANRLVPPGLTGDKEAGDRRRPSALTAFLKRLNPGRHGNSQGGRKARSLQLVHCIRPVDFHGPRTEVQLIGDKLVRQPRQKPPDDL